MRQLNFDLDVLRSFVTGIELGSFAKAADRLGRSTSAVSAQLKKLEAQIDLPILRKSGRGLVLTPRGETLFSYAKRLLELNDEAATAVRSADLAGCVRLGLQEDFGESLLTEALGSFARTHPQVRIEARVARNAELLDLLGRGQLDLALAWDSGQGLAYGQCIAELPMCWIGRQGETIHWQEEPLPLVAFEAPCLMRKLIQFPLFDRSRLSLAIRHMTASMYLLGQSLEASRCLYKPRQFSAEGGTFRSRKMNPSSTPRDVSQAHCTDRKGKWITLDCSA